MSNFAPILIEKSEMEELKNILVEREEDCLVLIINRPESLNALNKQIFDDLEYLFYEYIPSVEGLRGIVLTGAGEKAFVAGADIKEFSSYGVEALTALSKNGQRIFAQIEKCHVPVIAAVNGFALGGGCELAMSCHMRIAAENARFGQPEVNLGLIPGYGGTQRLPKLIGYTRAMELLLTARIIDAYEAEKIGLVNKVVPVGQSLASAKELINTIATKGPIAISKTIESVNALYDVKDGFDEEARLFGECAATKDFIEGTTAFIEKRKANFTNS